MVRDAQTVIAAMRQQRLELLQTEGSGLSYFQVYQNFLLYILLDDRFVLVEQVADGSWRFGLASALPEDDLIGDAEGYDLESASWAYRLLLGHTSDAALLWDGETLPVAVPAFDTWKGPNQTGVFISGYDSSRIKYVGRYDSSLGPKASYLTAPNEFGQMVSPFGSKPLTLSR